MSGKVIVVDVSSLHTFDQVKFWIWVKEGYFPYQQNLFRHVVEVDKNDWIKESCDVSLVVEDKISAMYKVLISSGWRNLFRADEGIGCVRNMINLATCRRPWGEDVGMFTDDELEKLRVMLATDYRWNLGIEKDYWYCIVGGSMARIP
jgi:hypothetical protein